MLNVLGLQMIPDRGEQRDRRDCVKLEVHDAECGHQGRQDVSEGRNDRSRGRRIAPLGHKKTYHSVRLAREGFEGLGHGLSTGTLHDLHRVAKHISRVAASASYQRRRHKRTCRV